MHTMKIDKGGFLYPYKQEENPAEQNKDWKLAGYGGTISVIGLPIPQNKDNFAEKMRETEEKFLEESLCFK